MLGYDTFKAKELALEMAQIAADTAGLVDPSPVSDGISAAIRVARGDLWGAALSVVSMLPHAGDAVAKPIKAVRAAKSVQRNFNQQWRGYVAGD